MSVWVGLAKRLCAVDIRTRLRDPDGFVKSV